MRQFLLRPSHDLKTIRPGHVDICNHQIWLVLPNGLQCIIPLILHRAKLKAHLLPRQTDRHHLGKSLVVVNQNHLAHFHPLFSCKNQTYSPLCRND